VEQRTTNWPIEGSEKAFSTRYINAVEARQKANMRIIADNKFSWAVKVERPKRTKIRAQISRNVNMTCNKANKMRLFGHLHQP